MYDDHFHFVRFRTVFISVALLESVMCLVDMMNHSISRVYFAESKLFCILAYGKQIILHS